MKTYIALLRGINVSGHNKMKMSELTQIIENLGYCDVQTYIQSGNVLFSSIGGSTSAKEKEIKQAIKEIFGYDIKVLVLSKNELMTIFKGNPFLPDKKEELSKLHVTLLKDHPDDSGIAEIKKMTADSDDLFENIGKSIYLYCPNGYGRTKLNNNLFEKKMKSSATTRNWKTISKLVELSN